MADSLVNKVFRRGRRLLYRRVINCNFCGQSFVCSDVPYSETQECPTCGSIARERVIYQVIQARYHPQANSIAGGGAELAKLKVLELSPRHRNRKLAIYQESFSQYVASDYDLKGHSGDVRLDLTNAKDVAALKGKFDVVICTHVLEHIPDYEKGLWGLSQLINQDGLVLLQVPFLESRYTPVTWDEFHGDNTRTYHRFAFDLSTALARHFKQVELYLANRNPKVVNQNVDSRKFQALDSHEGKIHEFSAAVVRDRGLGSADMCEAFALSN